MQSRPGQATRLASSQDAAPAEKPEKPFAAASAVAQCCVPGKGLEGVHCQPGPFAEEQRSGRSQTSAELGSGGMASAHGPACLDADVGGGAASADAMMASSAAAAASVSSYHLLNTDTQNGPVVGKLTERTHTSLVSFTLKACRSR